LSQTFQDWKELLETVLSPTDKQQIAQEIGVSSTTLTRWISGESRPRMHNLRLLLQTRILRPYHETLQELLERAFPGEPFREVTATHLITELPAELYAEILVNLRKLTPELRTWGICELLLDRMIRQFDPESEGMLLLIVQCVSPHEDKVAQLQEMMLSSRSLTRRTIPGLFLGIETLAGQAVAEGTILISQRDPGGGLLHASERYKSAAAFPLMRCGRVAGALVMESPLDNYFTPERKKIVEKYTDLLALAFFEEQFFPLHTIALRPSMPQETQQAVLQLYLNWTLEEYVHAAHPSVRLDDAGKKVQATMKELTERISQQHETGK
jgi:transcriptional regulator with XRE-family HTH domain